MLGKRALDLSWVGLMADQKHRLADSQMASLPPFYHCLVLIVLVTWIHSAPDRIRERRLWAPSPVLPFFSDSGQAENKAPPHPVL